MKFTTVTFILILISLSLTTCNVDHGIAPLPGKVSATVYFRGTPPEDTQGIYLTVAPIFPPHAINELYHSPNSLPIDLDTVHAEMELPCGRYQAISLWWYSTETKSNLADVLSIPLDIENSLLPMSFEITPDNPVFEIDLYANWDKVNRDAAIEGTIYFNGPFPENTLATAIAAYQFQPEETIHYLLWLTSMYFSIDANPYHYRLPIRHGSVNYLAVFWLSERAALSEFQTIGLYRDPNNPAQAGKLSIKADSVITNIDIYADWSAIHP